MTLGKLIINLYDKFQSRQFARSDYSWWKQNCMRNGINPNEPQAGEEEYLALWRKVTPRVEPYTYRFFSHRIGCVPYIVPETIGHLFLERYLNPLRHRSYYADKNAYGLYLNPSSFPKILVSRINGSRLLNGDFRPIPDFPEQITNISSSDIARVLQPHNKVCIKPAIDSNSGRGVIIFSRDTDGVFRDCSQTELNGDFLNRYGTNFNIQELFIQHPYLAQFNDTSVNTMRICAYRSVVDERIIVSGALIRIGAKGAFVDNAHAGGHFVGIDVENGRLQKTTFDQYGTSHIEWNGIDFSKTDFVIPEWHKIVTFAKELASRNIHMRLHSMDISLDCSGNPKMIEMNYDGFAYWLFMMCGQNVFAGETEKVIEYCKRQKQHTIAHLRIQDM